MPGLEGGLEEWQTQEVNVTRGVAEGDIDLEGAIPQGHPRAQALFVLLFPTVLLFHAHINIHWFSSCEMTDSHTPGLHVIFSNELQKQFFDSFPLPPSLY